MFRSAILFAMLFVLAGCGVAETGAAAAAAAAQAQQGRQTEERVKQQLDAAYQQAAEQRKAAEVASQ